MEDDRPRRRHTRTSQTPRWILLSTYVQSTDIMFSIPFGQFFYRVGWGRSRSSLLTAVRVV